ncbi:uncharacterized protein DMAD_02234 [Drosophila madeirensis]|uniref:Uncharacterized protein n=1 Tax=Drosophila madeirensis TaxID=30013 RepID=A0AAU9G2X0_DROMD
MSGAQGGCATATATQTPYTQEHVFKRPAAYPRRQKPQVPEHLEYHYALREYGLPLWPLQTTPHAMHPAPPPLPPQMPMDRAINEELNQRERRRLTRRKLQQRIKMKQIRLLQRRIERNTMEIKSLQSQMKHLERLMPRPPQQLPQLQPVPSYCQAQQQAFELYRPYL